MESDFKYTLVLALLIYLGAVRIAIRQRLGALSVDMKKAPNRAGWFALWTLAQRKSRALVLLIPADVLLVGAAAVLLYKLAGGQDCESLKIVIEGGILLGAGYLLLLHALEWFIGYRPSTREHDPPPLAGEAATDKKPKGFKEGRFNARPLYWAVCLIPLLVLLGLWAWPIWGPQLGVGGLWGWPIWGPQPPVGGPSTQSSRRSMDRSGPSTAGGGSPAEGNGPPAEGNGPPTEGGGRSLDRGGASTQGSGSPADGGGRSMDRGGPSTEGSGRPIPRSRSYIPGSGRPTPRPQRHVQGADDPFQGRNDPLPGRSGMSKEQTAHSKAAAARSKADKRCSKAEMANSLAGSPGAEDPEGRAAERPSGAGGRQS